jgi:uncharacterized membrane protein YfcA
MDVMMIAGLAGALTMGILLGVLGGGGSILTIPLLVYVLGLTPVEATGYSMFIVGTAALAGAFGYYRRGWLNLRVALLFVAPSVLAVYLTRHYVMPALPERFSFGVADFSRGPDFAVFALLLAATIVAFLWMRCDRWRLRETHRALVLAVPAAVAVYVTRRYALPLFPENGLGAGHLSISRDLATMLLLAVVMLATGIAMLRGRDDVTVDDVPDTSGAARLPLLRLGLQGGTVGVLTGALGAGGGFLITPALVLLAKLPLRIAVGTSLLIVGINSLTGFAGDLHRATPDWPLLLTLTGLALGGVILGATVSTRLPAALLRRGLGWLLTVMAFLILAAELMR